VVGNLRRACRGKRTAGIGEPGVPEDPGVPPLVRSPALSSDAMIVEALKKEGAPESIPLPGRGNCKASPCRVTNSKFLKIWRLLESTQRYLFNKYVDLIKKKKKVFCSG